jgi:hypothetical protein
VSRANISSEWISSYFLLNNFIISNCVVSDKCPRFGNRVFVKVFVSQRHKLSGG